MKTTATPPLLALRITELTDLSDIYLVIEPGSNRIGGLPSLIVHCAARTWSMSLPDINPVEALACMSTARLRDGLEYSRPANRNDPARARQMTSDLGDVIPPAVRAYLASIKP